MKIVADPNIPFVREAFGELGIVELIPGRSMTASAVRDARAILVRSVTQVDAALLDGSAVEFVGTATIGTDHVDLDYLQSHGIAFASAAGSNANSVAEYVITALLELGHRRRFRLRDQTLGVVGVGHVGQKVVQYAAALGMTVLQNDPPRQRREGGAQFVPLARLLAESDSISFHVPLIRDGDDATYHLVGGDQLSQFILINTSRGAVVDNAELLQALRSQKLHGAVVDVWENEPTIAANLVSAVDIATPHIAGYSFDGKVKGTAMIHAAFCLHFNRNPEWQPSLPPGQQLQLTVKPGDDDEDVVLRVIRRCYQIMADDAALRWDLESFDQLRANYPLRREFYNSHVLLSGGTDALRAKLGAIGFQVA